MERLQLRQHAEVRSRDRVRMQDGIVNESGRFHFSLNDNYSFVKMS